MRVSYRWLTGLLGFEMPLDALLERMTMAGIEVEAVLDLGMRSGKVVVGQILEINAHPNAENLVLCRVNTGETEPLQIVCGAKNMKAGDRVPVAIEGAGLPNGTVIKKSKIRGEVSMGMMCSGRELGWDEDHAGLLILPVDNEMYKLGMPFDALIETKVTPNRPDCLSVFGIARDVAAACGRAVSGYPPHDTREGATQARDLVRVRVEAGQQCPRYTGRVITGVTIGPSPRWLQRAVESAGIRSINNVVDVTNFVLAELGQPLHAFDLDRVAGPEIIIRLAGEGEQVETLDGQVNELAATDLLIADPDKPIALAGIMGCGNSEICDTTRNVFLECAYFDPSTIRKTSKRLGKTTESSYRFERGADWQNLRVFTDRAARLIVEVAGGEVAAGFFDEGPGVSPPDPIVVSCERVGALLGTAAGAPQISLPLRNLGFEVEPGADEQKLVVRVPSFRPDVTREADIVEEVARIIGYDKIPSLLPAIASRAETPAPEADLADLLRGVFREAGFSEVTNYSFIAAEAIARLGMDPSVAVPLRNPLSAEYAVLRTTLVPGVLGSVAYNQNHGSPDLKLFEVGKVFAAHEEPGKAATPLNEQWQFVGAISGSARSLTWRTPSRPADFHDGKAVAGDILVRLGVADCETVPLRVEAGVPFLHPGKSAELCSEGQTRVIVGELHPKIRTMLELKRNVVLVLGAFDALFPFLGRVATCEEIPVFPGVSRDLALVADRDVPAARIEETIRRRAKSLLQNLRLFDVYEGERIAEGKKSLAYQLRFGAQDRTLTDEEVNQLQSKILADLKAKLGVELRA